MKLLTATEKRAIARDWKNALQFYEVPKSMWLLKRNGPILTGVYLARAHGGTRYSPEFHIHPLWQKFPCVSLDCQNPLMLPNGTREAFTYLGHQSKFDEIIERFRQQCPYAFVDQISSTILEDILNHNIATSEIWPVESFMDSVLCAVYCNKLEEVEDRIDKCKRVLLSWPEKVLAHCLAGVATTVFNSKFEENVGKYTSVDDWESIMRFLLDKDLNKVVEEELVAHKLTKLKDHGFKIE